MANAKRENIEQLYGIFGNKDLSKSVISHVYDANNGKFDDAVDALLNMTNDATGHEKSIVLPNEPPSQPKPRPGAATGPIDRNKKAENVKQLQSWFNDLTVSVISTVYDQNKGDVQETVETLLNVCNDEEAVEQIRTYNKEQKKKLEEDMQQEAQKRAAEQQLRLKQEQEELARKLKLEQEKARKEYEEYQRLQKEKQELLQKERERQLEMEKQRAEIREREEKEKKMRIIMEQRMAATQEERKRIEEDRVKRETEAQDKQRHHQQFIKDLVAMKQQRATLEKKLEEQERELLLHKEKLEEQNKEVRQKETMIVNLKKQEDICTLSARYSTKTVVVSWKLLKLKSTKGDWIGFFEKDQPNTKYIRYIKTHAEPQGNNVFEAPKTPGLYEFRFFQNGSYNDVVRSPAIHIGPQVSLKAELAENNLVNCTWTLESGSLSPKAGIGFFPISSPSSKPISLNVLNVLSNTATFTVPAPRKPGEYEFRFLPNSGGYRATARSNSIEIVNKDKLNMEIVKADNGTFKHIKLTWKVHSVDVSKSDWIALYKPGATNNDYITYQWVDKVNNLVEFPIPSLPGHYQLRYHSRYQSKLMDIARTPVFQIEDQNSVTARVEGNKIKVTWNISTTPVSSSDWIALYKEGVVDNKSYISTSYVDMKKNYVLLSKPKTGGTFIVRYFSYAVGSWYQHITQGEPLVL